AGLRVWRAKGDEDASSFWYPCRRQQRERRRDGQPLGPAFAVAAGGGPGGSTGCAEPTRGVVPIAKVADFGTEVRLALRASELDGLDLFNSARLQAIPDHWEMPARLDQR